MLDARGRGEKRIPEGHQCALDSVRDMSQEEEAESD